MAQGAKCDVCRLNWATVKERRKLSPVGSGVVGMKEFMVCWRCARLSNFWFVRIMKAQDKAMALEEFLEGDWKEWIIK